MSEIKRTDEYQGDIIHEYDGIEEADNRLPNWWLWTLYGSVAFALLYWVYFQGFEIGQTPLERYGEAKLEAMSGGEVTAEMLGELSEDDLAVSAGRKLFADNCVKCHGSRAGGVESQGPNLTDPFWIHGGSAMTIYESIHGGRPNGMPNWNRLGPTKVKQLSAYVLSIRDTNVPGKAPQGERWPPEEEAEAAASGEPSDGEEGGPDDEEAPSVAEESAS